MDKYYNFHRTFFFISSFPAINALFYGILYCFCFTFFLGRPRPNVTWYLDNTVIDESFEQRPDGRTINHLLYPNIGRQHLNSRLTCVASNTNLTPPNNKVIVLDVNCKFFCLEFCLLFISFQGFCECAFVHTHYIFLRFLFRKKENINLLMNTYERQHSFRSLVSK